jgi:hypothetical protein
MSADGDDLGQLIALGRSGTLPLADLVESSRNDHLIGFEPRFAVGPDGRLWVSMVDHLASYDGSTWTTHQLDLGGDEASMIDVGGDGTVWLAADRNGPVRLVARLDAGGRAVTIPLDPSIPDGWGSPWLTGLAATPDGWAWLGFTSQPGGSGDARLLQLTDAGAQVVDPPAGIDLAGMTSLDRGADGTLWIYLADHGDGPSLVRFDGERWEVFVDGVPNMGIPGVSEGGLAAAPDGTVWVTVADQPIGLAHFDGERWTRYLADVWIDSETSLDVGPDGTLWARAQEPTGTVFRVRP